MVTTVSTLQISIDSVRSSADTLRKVLATLNTDKKVADCIAKGTDDKYVLDSIAGCINKLEEYAKLMETFRDTTPVAWPPQPPCK